MEITGSGKGRNVFYVALLYTLYVYIGEQPNTTLRSLITSDGGQEQFESRLSCQISFEVCLSLFGPN